MKCNTLRLAVLAIGLVSLSAWAQTGFANPAVVSFGWDHDNNFTIAPHGQSDTAFDQFLGMLTTYGVEPVDGISTETEILFPGSGAFANFDPTLVFRDTPTGTGSPTGITATVTGAFATDGTSIYDHFAIGPKSLPETDGQDPSHPVDTAFHISQPITAFGLYVMGGGDALTNSITFRVSNSITSYSADLSPIALGPPAGDHNIFFVGIGSDIAFNEITLLESNDFDGMVYDNIVTGTFVGVPEPGSFALLSVAGACLCALGRNRRISRD